MNFIVLDAYRPLLSNRTTSLTVMFTCAPTRPVAIPATPLVTWNSAPSLRNTDAIFATTNSTSNQVNTHLRPTMSLNPPCSGWNAVFPIAATVFAQTMLDAVFRLKPMVGRATGMADWSMDETRFAKARTARTR